MKTKKTPTAIVEALADEFFVLDMERQRIERESRALKKKLDTLRENLQELVGTAEQLDVPYVSAIGPFQITQVLRHRDVTAYSYDFVEFKVIKT